MAPGSLVTKTDPATGEQLQSSRHFAIQPAVSGKLTLRCRCEDGIWRYLHSRHDPVAEAEKWARCQQVSGGELAVILGGGLLYHAAALARRVPGTPIVVIDTRPELLDMARDMLAQDKNRDYGNLHCIAEGNWLKALDRFKTFLHAHPSLDGSIRLLPYRAVVQAFPSFFGRVSDALRNSRQNSLMERLRYTKFKTATPRVLLLTSQYFLMGEVISALGRLGIPYRLQMVPERKTGSRDFMEKLISSILSFRPDFLFTINHLGIDREGVLTEFLTRIEMPFASWYVDNPNLIIGHYHKNVSPYCTLFLWDRDTLPDMRNMGFENVLHLPLGVDHHRFKPLSGRHNRLSGDSSQVMFVGNSMVHKAKERLRRTHLPEGLVGQIPKIAEKFAWSDDRHVADMMRKDFPQLDDLFCGMSTDRRIGFETAICWEATRRYRLKLVRQLLPYKPMIAGDNGWRQLLPENSFEYHAEVSYYSELPQFYSTAAIHFNATSRQMKGAVNQRVFDVPACRRMLITDDQEQLHDLFETGREMICYQTPQEIGPLIDYYVKNESQRLKIVENGYRRVLRDHTYTRRLEGLIRNMKNLYGDKPN